MSVHQAATGRFVVKYRLDGRSKSVTVSRRNLQAHGLPAPPSEKRITSRHAKALDREIERMVLAGDLASEQGPEDNVQQAVEAYLAQLHVAPHHKKNKSRWLLSLDRTFKEKKATPALAEILGSTLVRDVTPDDIVAFRTSLIENAYENNTILNALRSVRSFFNWCVATKRCKDNPARAAKLPSADGDPPKILTPDEVHVVLKKAKGTQIERIFRLILFLGLRRQEAQSLQWEDVNLEKRVVVIRRRLKTARARREIPLPVQLRDFLLPANGEHVLEQPEGGPYADASLSTLLRRFKAKAKLPFSVTFRVCRATYGSFLISRGFQLPEVSRFLGHSSVSITERWYYGLRPSEYSERVDEAFDDMGI